MSRLRAFDRCRHSTKSCTDTTSTCHSDIVKNNKDNRTGEQEEEEEEEEVDHKALHSVGVYDTHNNYDHNDLEWESKDYPSMHCPRNTRDIHCIDQRRTTLWFLQ